MELVNFPLQFTRRRFFEAKGAALDCVLQVLDQAHLVRIATAYFEASGYQLLQDTLAGKRVHLMVGRGEGGRDNVTEVLDEFERELSRGYLNQRTKAMRLMLETLESGLMQIRVGAEDLSPSLMDARYLYHHAKLYIADEAAAVVGSTNFSYSGLQTSREAGITVTEPDDVRFFVERFDAYFNKAQSITQPLIDRILAWLKQYDPFVIYARALLELYGLPEEGTPESLPPLAPYQRAIVSSVLTSLLEQRGAILIASTGLGKTYIAAHTAAYLRMQGEIDSVLVISPAGLRKMWQRTMYSAKTASEEYSYHTLSVNDSLRDSELMALERQLHSTNDKTLIILDESHHLRNEDDHAGDIRLRNERIFRAVHKNGAKLLMMTATPFSKNVSDINNQLRLLPQPNTELRTLLGLQVDSKYWNVFTAQELTDLPICTVLTTPDVVQHFGNEDEQGQRYVEFGQGHRRYFPRRLTLKTIVYQNPLDDLLVELLSSKLLNAKRAPAKLNDLSPLLLDPETFDNTLGSSGRRNPFYESIVLHQFCSSLAQIQHLCKNLETGGANFEFQDQDRLTQFIRARQEEIDRAAQPRNDTKLNELVKIIKAAQGEKVAVFCHYVETANHLKTGLLNLIPRLKVDTTIDKNSQQLDRLLEQFAPVANGLPEELRDADDEIQVLICTSAMAEGFNLQDSRILVNYDLPWTILQLAQRMGRILRPWSTPRDVLVYNFIPSTLLHPKLTHARNWNQRLLERSEHYRSFAQIPILIRQNAGSQTEEWYELEQLANELYTRPETNMELDDVLDFIQNADALTTSSFYKDLVNITNTSEIEKLPYGIRSARIANGKKRLFVLFRCGRQVQAGLFGVDGRLAKNGDRRDDVMKTIRCSMNEPKAPAAVYPEDDTFDAWIESARQTWARLQSVPPDRLQIVCAMALLPKVEIKDSDGSLADLDQ